MCIRRLYYDNFLCHSDDQLCSASEVDRNKFICLSAIRNIAMFSRAREILEKCMYHSNIDCVILNVLSSRNFLIDHFSMLEVASGSIHSLANFQ